MKPVLDRIDRRLLALLQRNNRRPLRDLAADVAISAPTCLRRIRRLEAEGVIRGHAARVDARRAGFGVSAYIEVSLVSPSGPEMRAFERRMARLPEVLECAEIAGDVDYLLRVVASDMHAFGDFTRAHLAEDRRVRAYRSLLVLRAVKDDPVVPT
jgi:Lrp/AsnC family transcriptional regulator, leucine-responsive regulatory protein